MDTIFEIMNIRDIHPHEFQCKPSPMPFTSIDDPRFSWLRNVFLQYFEDWSASIEQRDSNFSKKEKNKIFITQQIYGGLTSSVNSVIEAIQFLLQNQERYVLTERFCQDPLDNYFGRQCSLVIR